MRNPKLVCSPIQLVLENEYKIHAISKMERVEVNLDGVKSLADFEVIEIVDETNLYSTFLGINWEFDNSSILNLKNNFFSL